MPPRKKSLRIATFNVNGIRPRLPHLIEWLEREQPDIACLQELKAADASFPAAEIERAGYGALWAGQVSWNGVAVLARGAAPVESRRRLPGERADEQARYLEVAAHGVIVACIYLPNGNPQPGPKFDYKLRWFERLIRHARTLYDSGHPVVLAGDFNVVPTDEDIYDPKHWRRDALLQPEARDAWQRLLAQGWMDALRAEHPERIYTFWDYFRQHWQRDRGLRIDHLLLNAELQPRLLGAGVDRWVRDLEKASDHAPTWITLAPASTSAAKRSTMPATAPKAAKPAAARKASASKAPASKASALKKAPAGPATSAVAKKARKSDAGDTASPRSSRSRDAHAMAVTSRYSSSSRSSSKPSVPMASSSGSTGSRRV